MRRAQGEPPLILLALLALGLAIGLSTCSADESDAIRTAEEEGYSNVRVVDMLPFAGRTRCGSKHAKVYELEALDRLEHPVRLIACCLSHCTTTPKD